MNPSSMCPVCRELPADFGLLPGTGATEHTCPRCGTYDSTMEFVQDSASAIPNSLRPYLSAATRAASEQGQKIELTTKNWRDLAEQNERATVTARVDKLLRAIAKKSRTPGTGVLLTFEHDFPLAGASNSRELVAYLQYVYAKRFIFPLADENATGGGEFTLTVDGWQAIEPRPNIGGEPGRCFVAMSFDPALDDAYAMGIKPAIEEDLKQKAVCMKEIATNEGITDRILSEIRLAEFVVADFTGQRGGVYFEAGFARGLGYLVMQEG
jgi:hypothetical protein